MPSPDHLFIHSGSTQRATNTLDAGRSPVQTYSTNLSSLSCLVQPLSGKEEPRYGRDNTRITVQIYVNSTLDIIEDDWIVVSSKYYRVHSIINFDLGGYSRLDCSKTLGQDGN